MRSVIIFLIIGLSLSLMGASGCSNENSILDTYPAYQNDTNWSDTEGMIPADVGSNPTNGTLDVSMEVSENVSNIIISNSTETSLDPVSSEEKACTITSEKIKRELKELSCTAVNKDNSWTVLYECIMGEYCAGMMILDASNGRIVYNAIY